MVGRGTIEVRARRVDACVELDLIVAPRQHPFAFRHPLRPGRDRTDDRFQRGRCGRRDVYHTHGQAGGDQVQVVVDQARACKAALQVDHFGLRPLQLAHFGVRAGGQNLALPDR